MSVLHKHQVGKERWSGVQKCLSFQQYWKENKGGKLLTFSLLCDNAWGLKGIHSIKLQCFMSMEQVKEVAKGSFLTQHLNFKPHVKLDGPIPWSCFTTWEQIKVEILGWYDRHKGKSTPPHPCCSDAICITWLHSWVFHTSSKVGKLFCENCK